MFHGKKQQPGSGVWSSFGGKYSSKKFEICFMAKKQQPESGIWYFLVGKYSSKKFKLLFNAKISNWGAEFGTFLSVNIVQKSLNYFMAKNIVSGYEGVS